ncbi:MAG TPA: GAP family protein [Actinomycetota bacterium]|jgi:threonine/homoserine/homoserine lactone efflux protein
MWQTVGDFLPLAVALTIIPIPIIAVILMLFTDRARQNSLAFLMGWVVGVAAAMGILIAIASTQELSSGEQPSSTASWIKTALGVVLIVAAVLQWRKRPEPGVPAAMPGWMQKVDSMRPAGAFGLGIVLSALNPKNLVLIAGAAADVAQADLSTGDRVLAVAIFTAIGSLSIAIPTLGYLFVGARLQPSLDRSRGWLTLHNAAVMTVVLLMIGVVLLGRGLGSLL